MKRSGFTMIELIFVIVILGILASVAIPKLAATRDDAEISKAATTVATLVSDFGTYYTARTELDANASTMTNVNLNAVTTSPRYAQFRVGQEDDCLKFTTTASGDLNITKKASPSSAGCKGAIEMITTWNYSFGGSSIVR